MNHIINRDSYINNIKPFMNTDLIKVLTGIRRSGKSVMLDLIKEELIKQGIKKSQIISINFEDLSNFHLCDAISLHNEISKLNIKNKRMYLFFDEIQEVANWEKAINSFRVQFDCDIYITGSNAKLLSSELATYLSGRYIAFNIYPFSFSEFLQIYRIKDQNLNNREIFNQYVILGGLPYLSNINFDKDSSLLYLKDLFNSLLFKDVVKRNNIKDIDLLTRIVNYIYSNMGNTFSATNISKYFKNEGLNVAVETILNYINALEAAYLIHKAARYDIKGKKILSTNEKYYITDHGIRHALFDSNFKDINLILENIIYLDSLKKGYFVCVGKINDKEIDFILTKNDIKIYIQVSYLLSSEETINREFKPLKQLKDNYPKYVLSLDDFDFSKDGIIHKNIIDFLLSDYI